MVLRLQVCGRLLTNTGRYYQAALERLDFADGEAASQVINTWVTDQTNQKITFEIDGIDQNHHG